MVEGPRRTGRTLSRRWGAGSGASADPYAPHATDHALVSATRTATRGVELVYRYVRVERLARTGQVSCCLPFPFSRKKIPAQQRQRITMNGSASRDDLINRFIRYPGAMAIRLRIVRLRLLGVRIGRRCWIRRIHVPRNPWDIVISDGVALDDYVVLLTTGLRGKAPKLVIDSGTYINRFTMFDASESIEVGRNCLIGPFCYITDHDHGTKMDSSQSPAASCQHPGSNRK